jgi:hypothetical protein
MAAVSCQKGSAMRVFPAKLRIAKPPIFLLADAGRMM